MSGHSVATATIIRQGLVRSTGFAGVEVADGVGKTEDRRAQWQYLLREGAAERWRAWKSNGLGEGEVGSTRADEMGPKLARNRLQVFTMQFGFFPPQGFALCWWWIGFAEKKRVDVKETFENWLQLQLHFTR